MQHSEVCSTPERSTTVAPTRVTTTLYDVIAALQSVVEPEEDDVVVAIVAAWLRSGRHACSRGRDHRRLRRKYIMAIVVLEEILGRLDEVKEALDQAITVLTDLVEECDPALVPHLPEVLDRTLLQPFTAHRAAVEHLLVMLAKQC